ncbi:MAG: transcriptional regulator [Belnapia sp.]|nr:transcriptional regulator [Belnapia sp.]
MPATSSPFADPLLWGRPVPGCAVRLHRLTRLSGPFPLALGQQTHLVFLPTTNGGRVGLGLRPSPLLPNELLVVPGPQPAPPVWFGATGLLLLVEDAPLRRMMERLAARPADGMAPHGPSLAASVPLRLRDPLLAQLALALAEAMERDDRGALTGPLGEALVARLADALLARAPAPSSDTGGLAAWRLRRVEAFAREHLGRTIRLAELAAVAGLSVFHFSRAFKQTTGHAPQAWLMLRRLERVQELLADSAISLIDAAFEAGFCSHAHLTATFRRVLGTTPSAWRAELLDRGATKARPLPWGRPENSRDSQPMGLAPVTLAPLTLAPVTLTPVTLALVPVAQDAG